MKKPDMLLREYFSKASDENLITLHLQLTQQYPGDLGEALNTVSQNQGFNEWLEKAEDYEDLYDMIDLAGEYSKKEINKRFPHGHQAVVAFGEAGSGI
jgi:hypothetical protein